MRDLIFRFLLPCLLASGCGVEKEPSCEEWIDGTYRALPVAAYEIAGSRDGSTTSAVATMTLGDGDVLKIEIAVEYDPAPVLRAARWTITGGRSGSGDVAAESLRFLGGQGEGPSLGGRYRLEAEGLPVFRVELPLQPVSRREWGAG
ncbi:MAG: hypothetical protein HKN20_13655 [Gemmatimonadetes bacterium]|nr:hypothetical protein [Gemmatimonadota bacterium]